MTLRLKAENSVLGGLLSGNNSTLESKTLELADNFNVLGGAKVKAKNLSLRVRCYLQILTGTLMHL